MNAPKRGKAWPQTVTVNHASVKVYRESHPDTTSGFIYVLAWNSNGVRKREKFADHVEALREARNKATELARGRLEGASLSTGDRDELLAARAFTKGVPLLTALQEWAKVREITDNNPIAAAEAWAARNVTKHERQTVAAVVEYFLKAKASAGVQTKKNHNHIFTDLKATFGERHIDTIGAVEIGTWLARRAHPSTRNTFRKHSVGLWRWARKQGYLPRDLETEAEKTDQAIEAPHEIGIISPQTFCDLLAEFSKRHPDYLPALVLAGYCGLRRSEIHAQTWTDINLDRKFVRVTKAKKGTPSRRLVPLCDAAIAWLQLTEEKTNFVCANLAVDRIRKIARTAGIDVPENAFRHSFISYRVAATGSVSEVAIEAGNSPAIIFKHYRELVTKEEAQDWFAPATLIRTSRR